MKWCKATRMREEVPVAAALPARPLMEQQAETRRQPRVVALGISRCLSLVRVWAVVPLVPTTPQQAGERPAMAEAADLTLAWAPRARAAAVERQASA